MKGTNNNKDKKLPSYLDDCDRPACHDTSSALQSAFLGMQNKYGNSSKKGMKGAVNEPVSNEVVCPPGTVDLGKSGWTLLHSMAAWYPDVPSMSDQNDMTQFLNAFAKFYPCTYCANDFQESLKKMPPEVESRKELCVWLCEQHNVVNEKLGKSLFSCKLEDLDRRWRKGGSECDDSA